MTKFKLVLRSAQFYWRTNLGVLLGTILTCAILTGALVVGDSVRYSLEQLALSRLGKTSLALISQEEFFRAALAEDIEADLKAPVAPVLMVRGSVVVPGGAARANEVQVIGADDRFWKLAPGMVRSGIASDSAGTPDGTGSRSAPEAVVNARLAAQLGVRAGDSIVVRVEKPSFVSRDAPLSGKSDITVAMRVRVAATAGDADFGRFGLQANQVPPLAVFMPLPALQEQLQRAGQANVLLVGSETVTVERANAAVRTRWTLADAGLELRDLPGQVELRTKRVFLEPAVVPAAMSLASEAAGVLTYFVNEVRLGDKATPYSFVAATGAGQQDNEITINQWLAEDLGAKVGDDVTLKYYVLGDRRELREESAKFRVNRIVPTAKDNSWMPDYPGLADAENCRDWEPGIPIDNERIRPKDEEYWKTYRGTPKAFITLAAGQRLWSNRFGNLTAVRYPSGMGFQPMGTSGSRGQDARATLAEALREKINPASVGLSFQPVRERALAASRQSLDFGQLFIGFSFFLIIAALLLTAMLFVFNLEQRHAEVGLLRAVGFQPRQVWWLLLLEGLSLSVAGTVIGVAAGTLYTKVTLHGLATVWRDAVGALDFLYHAEWSTLLMGTALSLVAAVGAMALAQKGQARRPVAELLASGGELELSATTTRRRNLGLWIGLIGLVSGIGSVFAARGKQGAEAAEYFFSAGMLLLIAGIGFSHRLLIRLDRATSRARSLTTVGLRNSARRRSRSVTTISVLASGVFLIVAMNAFRLDPRQGARDRHSGTGGFAFYGQTALPVYEDLNSAAGREVFGLSDEAMAGVSVVPLRVREGDDASCLNLNRALEPRLMGVRAKALGEPGAFSFVNRGGQWDLLNASEPDGAVPAIGDQQTVVWALGKKLGDTLTYTGDRGQTVRVRIVGLVASSILQGGLLISEENFIKHFPSVAGYRAFLIDAPWERTDEVTSTLSRALQDKGLELVPAWRRLADFMAVENTYLGIFQALGGLGLLLGSIGLGIVVLRNVLERRGELALLQAVGFRRPALQRLVLSEHWLLIFLGVAIGLITAVLAVLPSWGAPGTAVPVRLLALTLAGLTVGGLLWSWLAARVALRGPLLDALRNE